jgi:hypothetical protein
MAPPLQHLVHRDRLSHVPPALALNCKQDLHGMLSA